MTIIYHTNSTTSVTLALFQLLLVAFIDGWSEESRFLDVTKLLLYAPTILSNFANVGFTTSRVFFLPGSLLYIRRHVDVKPGFLHIGLISDPFELSGECQEVCVLFLK